MIIPSFEEIEKITDSRYSLVILVSKRAKKLVDGAQPFVETESKKPVTIAIEEVLDGDIVYGKPMSNREYDKKIKAEKEEKLKILREEKLKNISIEEGEIEE